MEREKDKMGIVDAIDTPPKHPGCEFWGAQDDVQLPYYFHALSLFLKQVEWK